MSGLKIKPRDSDYVMGVNSPLTAAKVLVSGDWLPYFKFYEGQLLSGGDSDGCVLFSEQEVFDAWIEFLWQNKKISQKTWDWFDALNYLDVGTDGQKHFHSSPRFLQIMTGNGLEGNSIPEGIDAMRKYGVLPWKDFPASQDLTPQEYLQGLTQEMKNKALQFLIGIGGKNSIQYHWIVNGSADVQAMIEALQSSPLIIGVNVGSNWNQVKPTPPSSGANPGHAVANYKIAPWTDVWIYDHYVPNPKDLQNYPVWYAMQMVVSVNPPPPAPVPPQNPTVPQTVSWLTSLVSWLRNLLESVTPQGRAKLGGAKRSPKWPEFKKEFAKTHLKVCAVCGSPKVQLHHLKPFHVFPELELDPDNLLWLCENTSANHHLQTGHLGNFKSINPNGKEEIAKLRDEIRNRPATVQDIKVAFDNLNK